MSFNRDSMIAKRLQKELNEEARRRNENENNTNRPNRVTFKPPQDEKLALTDPKLEYIDPNPDIHALFLHFDNLFFWKKLRSVEVKWSPRMTSCAGICCYQGRGGLCSIRLSLPLLKLRPRKDLIETLLHEMIHAYLFVTHNNRDRNGHGPEFHKHMHRINKSAGTKITVFHTFHDEVRSYQQHWWKCQGPCQRRPPYFGVVRRAMNRAPGPSDFWWGDHQASCGGTYVKIREPEGYSANKKGRGGARASGKGVSSSKTEFPGFPRSKSIEKSSGVVVNGGEVKPKPKSGIHGYFSPSTSGHDQKSSSVAGGLLGSKSSHVSTLVVKKGSKTSEMSSYSTSAPFVPFSGKGQVLGGGSSIQRPTLPNLITNPKGSPGVKKDLRKRIKGTNDNISPEKRPKKAHVPSSIMDSAALSSKSPGDSISGSGQRQEVNCPVCNSLQNEATINAHLDDCIAGRSESADDDIVCLGPPSPVDEGKGPWYLECPGCHDKIKESEFDEHLNTCDRICVDESFQDGANQEDGGAHSSDGGVECPACPICGQSLVGALGAHLDVCLSSMPFDEEDDWD
ncbi:DNA-dependent metalloprotease dvc-1 [Hetaerina americana]|uniref:DNA-dependent metalloprotease dvc-1 n=1 Tax=Hetaerina americana TaxID=62018 RepID=UPI003A7F206F